MAISYVPALVAARFKCCSSSLFCGCGAQDVHVRFYRLRASRYIRSRLTPGTSCNPVSAPSAFICHEEAHTVTKTQRRGGMICGYTWGLNFHGIKQESSICERGRTDNVLSEQSRDGGPLRTNYLGHYALAGQGNWFTSRAESRSWPLLYEPCTRSLSFASDPRGSTRQRANEGTAFCLAGTGTLRGLTGAGTLRGYSRTSNSCKVPHLPPQNSMVDTGPQREVPVAVKAPLSTDRVHSGDFPGLVFTASKFCNHHQPVQRPLVRSQWQLSVVTAKVNLHGAARDPDLKNAEACVCSHCKTAVTRSLDILCRSCGRVLKPRYDIYKSQGYSFFDLLELEPDFALDPLVLDAKHKQLQKELHPDKNLNADEEGRSWNEEHRKQVVLAVTTLRCPARRVLHLLQHHFHCLPGGVEKEELERVTDSDLLTEVLELNETLEGVRTRDELDVFEKKIQEILQADEEALAATFRDKDITGMRKNAQRYMMHAGLLGRIKNWSPEWV